MEEWKVLVACAAEATAAAAMKSAYELRLHATEDKEIVRRAYKAVSDEQENILDNPYVMRTEKAETIAEAREACLNEADYWAARALQAALDIATGANTGSNAVVLAQYIAARMEWLDKASDEAALRAIVDNHKEVTE